MLSVYWVCFTIGGVFVLLAVLGGLDGADFEIHFDTDTHIDSDIEFADPPERSPESSSRHSRNLLRFLLAIVSSLKFWTFGICFFGLTGLVLSQLSLPSVGVAIAAVSMGIVCGALVSGILRTLRQRQVDSLVRANDLVGLTGTVELAFNAQQRGKIRLLVKGTQVSFIAATDEVKEFQVGEPVLVVGTEQNRLWVVSTEDLDDLPKTIIRDRPERLPDQRNG